MTARPSSVGIAFAICVFLTSWPRGARSAPTVTGQPAHKTARTSHTPAAVVCQPLFVCDIVLDPEETILAMATGDSVRWLLSTVMSGPDARTPHVLVKPTDYGLRTDLIITTDKRVCYLILVSARHDGQANTRLYYPVAEVAHVVKSTHTTDDDLQVSIGRLDFAYRMHGDRSFMPTRVMNDGAHTYIEMPSGIQDMSVVFAIASDGSDAVVNYRFRHGMFVVDGVPDRLTLVQGSGRGQRRVIIERGS